ncbi:MAG: hypothetical protein M3N29_08950 [Chloroflexota bacterium]|nr:hypothetical protein [Chloroflexota bacterium]
MKVVWPHGWSARHNGARLALVDDRLRVVAHAGDRVEVGGGATPDGWITCGDVTVVGRG